MRVDFNFFRWTDDRHQNRLLNPASRMRARGNELDAMVGTSARDRHRITQLS